MTNRDQQLRASTNREKFTSEMEQKALKYLYRAVFILFRSRFGFFNQPLPLTIGDDSTNY